MAFQTSTRTRARETTHDALPVRLVSARFSARRVVFRSPSRPSHDVCVLEGVRLGFTW